MTAFTMYISSDKKSHTTFATELSVIAQLAYFYTVLIRFYRCIYFTTAEIICLVKFQTVFHKNAEHIQQLN